MAIIKCEECGAKYSDKAPGGCPTCASIKQSEKAHSYICKNCGSKVRPQKITKGHIIIEIVLWIAFFPAGIVYSLWRHFTRITGCPRCQSKELVPLRTPAGRTIAKEFSG